MPHTEQDYRVGEWLIQPTLNRITGPDHSTRLGAKALEILRHLADHEGRVVSREVLLETIWHDTVVSEDSLNRAISDLRRAFQDDPVQPRIIETIRHRGYRLIAPVLPVENEPDTTVQPPRATIHSIRKQRALILGIATLLSLGVLGLLGLNLLRPPASAPAIPQAVPVTTYPGAEFDVVISPDGEQIAFVALPQLNVQSAELHVKPIGVETPLQLTDNIGIEMSPAWSPDGKALAFLRGTRDGCALYMMPVSGGDERKLTDCKEFLVTGVSWSPDGQHIAFSDRPTPQEPFQVFLIHTETLIITPLTLPSADHFGDFSAVFSPDGQELAFVRGTTSGTTAAMLAPAIGDIHVITLSDHTERRLTFDDQEIPHIDWTRDGSSIVFASNRTRGAYGIWKIAAEGGTPEWVLGGNGFVRKPSIARNANRMTFEQWENQSSIWQQPVSATSDSTLPAEAIISSTHWDATPQYNPDGTRLAFTSKRSGAMEIWTSNADGSHPIQLTSFGGPYTANPRWSPDGTRIAFETRTEGQADIYTIDARGGLPRQVTHHDANDRAPNWSRDGEWIYFGSNRNDTWQVWKIPITGGPAQQVTREGGFAAQEGSDEMLYFTHIDQPGLFRMPMEEGNAAMVISSTIKEDWGNWAVAENGIYFIQRAPTHLCFFDFATGSSEVLGPLGSLPIGVPSLSISPDGTTLVRAKQRHRESDVWMIDDFRVQ